MPPDLLDRIRHEITERKRAAGAAVEESRRLEAALAALGTPGAAPPAGPRAPSPAAGGSRARTPRGENRRRILEVVAERAGVSAAEVAQVTGIARPTVATTLGKLATDGAVERVQRPAGGVGFKLADPRSGGGPGGSEPDGAPEAEPAEVEPDAVLEPDAVAADPAGLPDGDADPS